MMKKLKEIIEKWLYEGNNSKLKISPYDFDCLIRVYNNIVVGRKPYFYNGNVKMVLDKCKIKTIEYDVGWIVV